MMSKKMVKIICIIMAALMVLSVGAVVLQVIATEASAQAPLMISAVGESVAAAFIPKV